MAGCDRSKETYKFTYDDTTKAVVAEHTDWSPTQVRLEVARIFRPQYRQNTESIKRELSGEKQYDGTPFTFDEANGVRFKNGDGSMGLLEFHERQLRLTPDKYSEDEHKVSLLIDQTIRTGASEVVTSYPRGDGQRDIVVMTIDRETGRGSMRVINTQIDHSEMEIKSISKQAFRHLSETSSGRTFILSNAPLSQEKVQESFSGLHAAIAVTPLEAMRTVKGTVHEISYTAQKVKEFWAKRDEKIRDILHPIPPKERVTELFIKPVASRPALREGTKVPHIPVKGLSEHGKLIKRIGEGIKRPHTAEEKVVRAQSKSERTKLITQHERKVAKGNVRPEVRIAAVKKHEVFSRKKGERKFMRAQSERVIFSVRRPKGEGRIRVHKELRQDEIVIRLVDFVKHLIRRKEALKSGRQTKEHVLVFSIAFLFWKLLRHQFFISQSKHFHLLIHESKIVRRHDQENQLQPKEPTPWLLLAIIWHLAMIRESGMRTIQTKPKQKKVKKNTYYPHFAPQGVIFAFAS